MDSRVAVIFDMDGVLVDSYAPHYRSWQIVAEEWNCNYTEELFASGFGRCGTEIIQLHWGLSHLTTDEMQEIVDRKEILYREIIQEAVPASVGLAELVSDLHQHHIPMAIGSSGPKANVELVAEKLNLVERLQIRVSGCDVSRGKPDPEVFLRAAAGLGVDAKQCIVIEDAPVGIEAAHNAGMRCIGLTSTGRDPQELNAADWQVDSLKELSTQWFWNMVRMP